MYVGTQMGGDQFARVGDRYLRQLAQLGVRHVCIDPEGDPWQWDRDVLMRHRDRVERAGLVLDMVQLPLPSSGIERRHQSPGIVLGRPGERDRETFMHTDFGVFHLALPRAGLDRSARHLDTRFGGRVRLRRSDGEITSPSVGRRLVR